MFVSAESLTVFHEYLCEKRMFQLYHFSLFIRSQQTCQKTGDTATKWGQSYGIQGRENTVYLTQSVQFCDTIPLKYYLNF